MNSAEATFRRTLGATILEYRVSAGIRSQKALADELVRVGLEALSEATVRRWEQGTHSPDAWELNRLCELFGCEPTDLLRPVAMTDREIQVLRRAGRQVHRTIGRERAAS